MKKHYLPLALAMLLVQGVSAQSRFDAASQIFADHYMDFVHNPEVAMAEVPNLPFTLDPVSRSEPTADVLIILNEGTTAEDIESYGLTVRSVVGGVAVANGNVADIIALADTDLSVKMSFSVKSKMLLDNARSRSGVDQIHSGEDIAQPYKGKNIVTGIFDIGMDPNHVNFKTADLKNSRISKLWTYTSSGRVTVYDTPERIAGFTTDDRNETHGTHTMGCMAGSYNGNGEYYTATITRVTLNRNQPIPFYGMAPEAEIAAACGFNSIANIVDACGKLAEYIKASGKPGLISLSFGDSAGPHDGTDPQTYALNNIAKEIPFFIAAGNEGQDAFTFVKTFSEGDTQVKTLLKPDASLVKGTIDIWSANDQPLTVRLIVFDRTEKKEVYSYKIYGDADGLLGTSGYAGASVTDDAFDQAFTASWVRFASKKDPANNRYNTALTYNLTNRSGNRYVLGIAVEGNPGQHFDLVNQPDMYDSNLQYTAQLSGWDCPGWLDGTSKMSVSNLASGPDMLCIGAYNTRYRWGTYSYTSPVSYGLTTYNEGLIAPYSSYGTLWNGKTLPLVCAPGTGIISSVSRFAMAATGQTQETSARATVDGTVNYYQVMQGTSMATPVAAGIGALWLQANPDLTPADIKYIIEHTSTTDKNVTSTTDRPEAWGVGKINALEGIKMAIKIGAGVSDVTVNPADIIITANGNLWTVVAPGASSVSTVVYDLNGRPVIESETDGDTAEISGEHLQPGIYIINVNGTLSRRVAVK